MSASTRFAPRSVGLAHATLALGGFAIGTAEFATMSLLPLVAGDLHVSEPVAAHLVSSYALGVVVGAPLIATLGARLSRQMFLIVLMLLFGLGNGLSGIASSYESLLILRFVSGLPHGAYFGVASLVAASLVLDDRKTRAIGRVMLGLTVATIVGVPLANMLAQTGGWRFSFGLIASLAFLTAALIARLVPPGRPVPHVSPASELRSLRRPRLWLTLGVGAIGFGGLFSVYSFLASTLNEVTRVDPLLAPLFFGLFGIGLTLGNLIVPRFADRALVPTVTSLLLWSIAALLLYPWAAAHPFAMALDILAIGFGGALATVLQRRLMDIAEEGQGLAAALNHSAFNVANAIGPWLGGLAIIAGWGLTSTGLVGAALAAAGLVIWQASLRLVGPGAKASLSRPGHLAQHPPRAGE